jgi:tRNA threonylcarbamoyl adenosine modification protein YeaZ/ribosomal-protein-alanine acetyltransferase
MYILGVDTTQAACSAAIFDTQNRQVCARSWKQMPRGHAESLPGIIADALDQAKITLKDIHRLAVTTGPGTFTGVRVGLSAARGFALALELPLVGLNSLEVLAGGVENFHQKRVLAAFDARRDEAYVQLFENGTAKSEPLLLSVADAGQFSGAIKTEIVGTAGAMLAKLNPALIESHAAMLPDAGVLVEMAAQRQPGDEPVQPLYLRKADAKAQTPLLNIKGNKISLLEAGAEFGDVLAEIHKQGFSAPWSCQSIIASLASPGVCCWLAVDEKDNNRPLGFILVRDAAREREILTLAVRIDARRRRVARQLVEKITRDARKAKFTKIFLEVSDDNFSARKLYDKTGFSKFGVRKNYYTGNDGQKHDAILMALTL